MTKWFGNVGFALTTESVPGVWVETITDRQYYGDLIKYNRRLNSSDKVNDDVEISNDISIVADPFAYDNIQAIRYAEFMGNKWKVNFVDVQYPRITLSLGGLYNEH